MRRQPRHQLSIPLLCGGERLDAEHTTNMIDHGGDVHVGLGIDPAAHRLRVGSYDGHSHPSSLDGQGWHALAGRVDQESQIWFQQIRSSLPPDR